MNADVALTPVLVKMPSGDWCSFSTESKARSFIVDADSVQLLHGPNDLAKLGFDELKREYMKIVKIPYGGTHHDLAIAVELWGILIGRAKQPLAALEGKGRSADGPLGKRASLIYKCQYTGKADDPLKAAFEKLPKQAKVCLMIIQELEAAHQFVDSKLLERELTKQSDRLDTRQKSWRVFKYYQANMISEGLLRLRQR
jgi:hypothetical protein